jgi:two-component system cell cycle response regulator
LSLGPDLSGRRVLVVDDDRASVRLIRRTLDEHRYTFAEAFDGRAALAQVRDFRPDVVIMDVEMPGMGGIEVARILRAHGTFGFVPVILMTARGRGGKVEGLELGADDYLVKPLDPLELAARVKSMLRLKALQDALIAKNRELDLANQALLEKKKELEKLSRTDGLTGVFNRRYFEERFTGEFERSRRYRSALTVLMLDVDDFKHLNDSRGHPFGDGVLRGVAEIVRVTLRDVDLIGRYGGEEFIAALPETSPREASTVAERLRRAVAEFPFGGDDPVHVTASLGLACFPAPGMERPDELVRAADDALYRAKAAGKNRVAVSEA